LTLQSLKHYDFLVIKEIGLFTYESDGRMVDRRTFNKLTGLAAIGALSRNVELGAEPTTPQLSASPNEVVLDDDTLLAAFDANSGALTRFHQKSTQWAIQRRLELDISFRLLAPLPTVVTILSWAKSSTPLG
jgi:hypothetical protein